MGIDYLFQLLFLFLLFVDIYFYEFYHLSFIKYQERYSINVLSIRYVHKSQCGWAIITVFCGVLVWEQTIPASIKCD